MISPNTKNALTSRLSDTISPPTSRRFILDEMIEVWKPVPKYENWYEVSNWGRIRRSCQGHVTFAGRILSLDLSSDYARVTLYTRNGKRNQHVWIHQAVAGAFLGPCPPGYQVNHRNGEKKDNTLPNLEYVTPSENQIHRSRVLRKNMGETHHRAKLTEDLVREIRKAYKPGMGYRNLARDYGVSESTITHVITRRVWAHVV